MSNTRTFGTILAGRPLTVKIGSMAELAGGAALIEYGETVILATATMSDKPRAGIDFFPLSVDYEERLYAIGKIPGSFMRREGRPSEKAILTGRVIDRPMRPLFPSDLRNDVGIVATVLSVEQDNDPEVAAMIGCSIAATISDIPWGGPIAGVHVGLVDDELVVNPTQEQREKNRLQLTVAGTSKKVVMIEAGADQVPDDIMYDAIMLAHEEIKKLCAFIEDIAKEVGKPKRTYESCSLPQDAYNDVADFAVPLLEKAMDTNDKEIRQNGVLNIEKKAIEKFIHQYPDIAELIGEILYQLQKSIVRRWILDEGKRVDGRGLDEIRKLSADVSILPRTHGSGLFARGQTQVLTVATLGALGDMQKLDGLDGDDQKRYMHHYNFPSYSVGETRPSRGPGRREIGHGALAERALEPVLPSEEDFPYAIRLVSEVLSSNGSTSQGAVCGSTLALMDAGVPITAPVAGISVGLFTREDDSYQTILDIQGIEDFFGDMDFKVAGTRKGITAIQMDLKIDGLTPEIIKEALDKTKESRIDIINNTMLKAISEPRDGLSKYAPRVVTMKIDIDKIRDVIGTGGKVIQKIIADTGVKIDISDDGTVFILSTDMESSDMAVKIINGIVKEPEAGEVYTGKVVRIMQFGAFVEILPGKDGLVHISQLDSKRVEKVEDVVNIGDEVTVKVMEIDSQGRINLSMKALLNDNKDSEKKPRK